MWILGDRRATERLAEFSDTACFLPCKRCSELVQENDRFCRFCGVDQFDTDGDAVPTVKARSPIELDFAATLQPEEPAEVVQFAPMRAADEAVKPAVVLDRPNAFGQKRLLEDSRPGHRAGSSFVAFRLAIGMVSVGVLLALALGPNLDLEKLRATVGQMQSALLRGDLRSDTFALGFLDAGEAFNRQIPAPAQEEQPGQAAATRDRVRDATLEVSMTLGLGAPAARAAPVDVSPKAPMVATPAVEIGVVEPKQAECSEALAALAMCPKP
ncbi:MAG: hypothetical protein EOP82_31490 [Variovorax sp.]|nr:MAG: hypothetical protein EOP82_31490 [Variovorax sp.]